MKEYHKKLILHLDSIKSDKCFVFIFRVFTRENFMINVFELEIYKIPIFLIYYSSDLFEDIVRENSKYL